MQEIEIPIIVSLFEPVTQNTAPYIALPVIDIRVEPKIDDSVPVKQIISVGLPVDAESDEFYVSEWVNKEYGHEIPTWI